MTLIVVRGVTVYLSAAPDESVKAKFVSLGSVVHVLPVAISVWPVGRIVITEVPLSKAYRTLPVILTVHLDVSVAVQSKPIDPGVTPDEFVTPSTVTFPATHGSVMAAPPVTVHEPLLNAGPNSHTKLLLILSVSGPDPDVSVAVKPLVVQFSVFLAVLRTI